MAARWWLGWVLIWSAVVGLAAAGPAAAREHPIANPGYPWPGDETEVMLSIDGDSLEVVFTDPRHRQDVWHGAPHVSPIPKCYRELHLWTDPVFPYTDRRRAYYTNFLLKPIRGTYRLEVVARHAVTARIDTWRPFTRDCGASDSLAMAAGERRTWLLEWSTQKATRTCWTKMRLLPATEEPRRDDPR